MSQAIKDALGKLDPKNDNHWTADGQPRLETVKMYSGDNSLKREDLTRVAPEFSRSNTNLDAGKQPAVPATKADGSNESKPVTNTPNAESPTTSAPPSGNAGTPATSDTPTAGSPPAAETGGNGELFPDKPKKPNDLQPDYKDLPGLDVDGKEVGVKVPDIPSAAGQPGSTPPESIPQTATVPEIHPESNGDQQAEGSDGTTVVIPQVPSAGLHPSEGDTADGGGLHENDDSQTQADQAAQESANKDIEAADKEVEELDKQIDDLKKKRDEVMKRKDTHIAALEKAKGRNSNSWVLRSYIDKQNQIRSEQGTRKRALMASGFDMSAMSQAADPRSALDKSRDKKGAL